MTPDVFHDVPVLVYIIEPDVSKIRARSHALFFRRAFFTLQSFIVTTYRITSRGFNTLQLRTPAFPSFLHRVIRLRDRSSR